MAFTASGAFRQTFIDDWKRTVDINLDLETHKGALFGNSGTPDFDDTAAHNAYNGSGGAWVTANEVTGTGYTATGVALASKTVTYDTATDQIRLDAADSSWTTSTITARRAVVYKDTGTSTTSPLLAQVDFGADVSTTAGTFQITWDATGIVVFDVT